MSNGLAVMKARHELSAVLLGELALGRVGDASVQRLDWGNAGGVHVVHVRRPITTAEEALLPAWFLSCPAIDRAGFRPLRIRR